MTDQTADVPDRITVSRDQLAALLAHHADVIAARWDAYAPDPAAYALRTHAGELTAEDETPAVAGLLDSMMSFRSPADTRQAAGQPAQHSIPCGQCGAPWSDGHGQPGDPCTPTPAVGGQDATPPAEAEAQPPLYVWLVWREEQPIHAVYGTEEDAKRGSIDCWEEDEPHCPDYSWRPDGSGWELLVGDERAEVYITRQPVYGRHWVAAHADEATP
ncbi:hypothetical protein ABZ958_03275 [Streptomyces sp. NPDC046237]|uniref:hypothetical protein n=1 Tax=Streptomyces sp. NPDC046237 TaxID=3154914 RepID=UPI0033D4CBB6